MRIALLGSLQVDDGQTPLSPRDRVILLALASRPGSELSTQALAETLWGDHLPDSWQKVVQGCISRLRKALGPESVQTTAHGYRLTLHREEMDHAQFEHLLVRARQLLADGEPERALFVTGQARQLWRGEPFVELADWEQGRAESERLLELWRDAEDLHAEAGLRAGHHRDVLTVVSRLVHEQPTRERRWGLLALALYQEGRQGDALQTLHRAKQTLVEELGLDPGPELVELEQAILRQDPQLSVAAADLSPSSADCPYLGLIAYDIGDASTFFGRESDVLACLRRLGESGVVAILGPSGCGKSSLARAGVGAALERDGRRVHVMTPGPHPADTLTALHLRPQDVLVVDQCEEALALPPDSPQRTDFVDAVVAFAESGRGQLVVSMRADRLGDLSSHPELARVVESGLYLLGPMAEEDLRRAIEGPAAQAGLRLEPGLVDLLLREVTGEPAALPLLSHVLRQTWAHREGATLTVDGYAVTGGVRAAVAQSAEGLFRRLDARGQDIVRELMLRLVSPDEGGDPVRTRVPRRTVTTDAAHSELVEQLVAARLLASDGDTIEIAHESLAVAWPRLRSWLDEDVEGLRIMRHLSVAAQSWDELGRPDSELYRGTRQARASEWHARSHPALTPEELAFLESSHALAEREQRATKEQVRRERRLNNRLRLGLAGTAAALAVAIALGTVAKASGDRADREAATASQQARAADARRLGAEALASDDLDRSILLAAAGVALDDSYDTRSALLASLARGPALTASTRTTDNILNLAVNPATDELLSMGSPSGLATYDGTTLRPVPGRERLRGVGVASSAEGSLTAVSMWRDDVENGDQPAIVLLDRSGARASTQPGGQPPGTNVWNTLMFSADGRRLAARMVDIGGTREPVTAIWDLQAPARPRLLALPDTDFSLPSSDGRTVWSTGENRFVVTELPAGTSRVLLPPAFGVRQLSDVIAVAPDGATLALGAGAEVALVDTATLRSKGFLSGYGWVTSVAFSRDGTRVATAGDRLVVWDVTGEEPREVLVEENAGEQPAFSGDGTTVYTKTFDGLLQAWDLTGNRRFLKGAVTPPLDWNEPLVRFSPDGTAVGYVEGGQRFTTRTVATGQLGRTIEPGLPQRSFIDFAWHPDGTTVNVTSGSPQVRTWDATSGRQLTEHLLSADPDGEGAGIAFFSADGSRLVVGSTTGRIHALDARTLKPVRDPIQVYVKADGSPDPRELPTIALSPDNRTVFLPDRIVDYVSGSVRPMPDLGTKVKNLWPSPDGRRLALGTDSGLGMVDAATMRWIWRPNPNQSQLVGWSSAYSRDGRLFASVEEGRLSYWDADTGVLQATVVVDEGGTPGFSDDGRRITFAGVSGSVRTWDLDPASWLATACRLAGRGLTEQEWRLHLPNRPFIPVCAD
ncbi:nSTAND1 domain-containing NTPase [Knoellia sp. LjRoot47]|uniref:nSTAND1 domain-containing NTPase n=1 Tax=Knoellia sp. LjRoot47 TaxID=3342330 RepID=UPI003ED0E95B